MLVLHLGKQPFRRASDQAALLSRGVRLLRVGSDEDTIEHARSFDLDAVLIDLNAARDQGCELVSRLRRIKPKLPIIAVSLSENSLARASTLDLGADDVLTATCQLDETLARLRAVVRRSAGYAHPVVQLGQLELHFDRRELRANGTEIRISPMEYDLLELLFLRNGRLVSKSDCLDHLYGGLEEKDAKTVDVLFCRLRKKLAAAGVPPLIETVWGAGFRLQWIEAPPSAHIEAPPAREVV